MAWSSQLMLDLCVQEPGPGDDSWRTDGVQSIQAAAELQACGPFMQPVREAEVRLPAAVPLIDHGQAAHS